MAHEPADSDHEGANWAEILTVDPGGTTGWAVMRLHPSALTEPDLDIVPNVFYRAAGQIRSDGPHGENGAAHEVVRLAEEWPHAAVVIESFVPQQFNQGRDFLSPVRLAAAIAYGVWRLDGRGCFYQLPALAMTTATDARMKNWGFWLPGKPHATDANRHALTFYRRARGDRRIRAGAWPELFG